MAEERFLELKAISKRFGSTVAVNNLSMCVGKAEFITLLGPSGCGKTTTLRIIAGFVKPDEGSVYLKGEKIDDKPPYKRKMAMVFQNYALFPHMTVFNNLAFGLKMRRVKQNEIKECVKNTLTTVQLEGMEDRYPRELSGGQQQRVALGRALIIEPDVLLLDEPLSNLDFKLRQNMRIELKELQRKLGITTVYVTHDQGEALAMSDRIVILERGKVEQIGTPTQVYEHPLNKFVADFIGESNFFNLEISKISEQTIVLSNNDLELALPVSSFVKTEELKENAKVAVSVRTERVEISKKKIDDVNSFTGLVRNAVYSGSFMKYAVQVGESVITVNKLIKDKKSFYEVGERVHIHFRPEDVIILKYG